MDSDPVLIPDAAREKIMSLTTELNYRQMEDDVRWLISEFALTENGDLCRQMRMALPPVAAEEMDRQVTLALEMSSGVDIG